MLLELRDIQQIGNELALRWSDGQETYLTLEQLRRSCPCASCGGEPDVLGRIMRPERQYLDDSFILIGWDIVGGYAVLPRWKDGHQTGIYSFAYLRRLGSAQTN